VKTLRVSINKIGRLIASNVFNPSTTFHMSTLSKCRHFIVSYGAGFDSTNQSKDRKPEKFVNKKTATF